MIFHSIQILKYETLIWFESKPSSIVIFNSLLISACISLSRCGNFISLQSFDLHCIVLHVSAGMSIQEVKIKRYVGKIVEWVGASFQRQSGAFGSTPLPPGHCVAVPLDKALYGTYLCLVVSSKQQIRWKTRWQTKRNVETWKCPIGCGQRPKV